MTAAGGRRLLIGTGALFLALAVGLVFLPVVDHGFVYIDDGLYITENPQVRTGLTVEGIVWALTSREAANWHPLTWLSHELDVALFGLDAGKHHLMSLLIHLGGTLGLFLVLEALTGALVSGFLVALLFGIHPLHVESVAWAAERKDVLSGLLFMLALLTWVRYLRRPGRVRYATAALLFACGLMAKPMLVTYPLILLLLDFWPLGRTVHLAGTTSRRATAIHLLREKAPLFAFSAVSAALTISAQSGSGTIADIESLPPGVRLANALVAGAIYLVKTFWPTGLAFYYHHPGAEIPWGKIPLAAALLAAPTLLALGRARRRTPWLTVGWLWYLGMLLPVIGLVQVGWQSMADRYTYLPLIGIFLALAWGAGSFLRRHPRLLPQVVTVFVGGVILLCATARVQVGTWNNTLSLYRHAVAVTDDNWMLHYTLANILTERRLLDEAIAHYRETLRLSPRFPEGHNNLAVALALRGEHDEAFAHYREAQRLRPRYAEPWYNMGVDLSELGRTAEAVASLRRGLELRPDYPDARALLERLIGPQRKDLDPAPR